MRFALIALRILGGLGLGLLLGGTAVRVMGDLSPTPGGMLLPIIVYAVIGGGILVVAPPLVGVCLLLGWAAPWVLVGLVVATADVGPWVPFPVSITVLYLLALGLAVFRRRHRS